MILGLAKEDALEQSFGVGSMFVGLFNLVRLSTDFRRFFAKLKRREKIKLGMIDAVGSIMGLALGYVLLGPWAV